MTERVPSVSDHHSLSSSEYGGFGIEAQRQSDVRFATVSSAARQLRWLALSLEAPFWLAAAYAAYLVAIVHLRYIFPTPAGVGGSDEGYIAAFGQRMATGHMLPFVDAVSHRGPMLYWIVGSFAKVFGLGWLPTRLSSALVEVASVVFAFAAGRQARRPFAGAVAALALVLGYAVVNHPMNGIGYNGEPAGNAFLMASFFCLVSALGCASGRTRVWQLVLAGMLASIATLCKQVGVVFYFPMLLWLGAAALSRRDESRRDRLLLVGSYVGGAILPLAVTLLRYAIAGELHTLWYWTVTYNAKVYMSPYPRHRQIADTQYWIQDHAALLGGWLSLVSWAAFRRVKSLRLAELARGYDMDGFLVTAALESICAIVVGRAPMREFPHYYLFVYPWAGLFLGGLIDEKTNVFSDLRRMLLGAATLLPLVLVARFGVGETLHITQSNRVSGEADAVCAFVDANSQSTDTLFVWGWGGIYYSACKRNPASRFVFTLMVSGTVVGSSQNSLEDEDARASPGARETLLRELEENKPPIILMLPYPGTRTMDEYPIFEKYLTDNYCPGGSPGGIKALLRRKEGQECPEVQSK